MTKAAAWTSGSWEAVPEHLHQGAHAAGRTPKVVCGEKAVASVHLPNGAYRKSGPCEEAEANARLIAAAPELYEALHEAISYLAVYAATNKDEQAWALLHKCTAALEKASPS